MYAFVVKRSQQKFYEMHAFFFPLISIILFFPLFRYYRSDVDATPAGQITVDEMLSG